MAPSMMTLDSILTMSGSHISISGSRISMHDSRMSVLEALSLNESRISIRASELTEAAEKESLHEFLQEAAEQVGGDYTAQESQQPIFIQNATEEYEAEDSMEQVEDANEVLEGEETVDAVEVTEGEEYIETAKSGIVEAAQNGLMQATTLIKKNLSGNS